MSAKTESIYASEMNLGVLAYYSDANNECPVVQVDLKFVTWLSPPLPICVAASLTGWV